ncbi:hypothetical protein F5Y03DRAFT_403026 [Xylaria venustula]|nr:hypothetical protein F5Y03DRAFT_403026 [Xylaria venustula]
MSPSIIYENGRDGTIAILGVSLPTDRLLQVDFRDGIFTYHVQWLHDARNDRSPSRSAEDSFVVHAPDARITAATLKGKGINVGIQVTWSDGTQTTFPGAWLRALAPMVAKQSLEDGFIGEDCSDNHGWVTDKIDIPEVHFDSIFPQQKPSVEQSEEISIKICDMLFHEGKSGIIKVVGLPAPDVQSERETRNTIVTKILKQVFGSVFVHPRRGADLTFNVTDNYGKEKNRGAELHNYRTDVVLLPHCDHAHYDYPAQVQGLYCLEGESYNTFISSVAVLHTMQQEAPDLYPYLLKSPMVVGRVAHYYDPPMFQATVEPAATLMPGFPDQVKRIRWHPHLAGSLVTPFDDFDMARQAYQKYQEILRRPTHQLKVLFKPGDLYIWDNFRNLHGRESVISVPRTSVGQTVPEQVVSERYRSLQIKRLKGLVDESWLVHVPTPKLYDMAKLLGA